MHRTVLAVTLALALLAPHTVARAQDAEAAVETVVAGLKSDQDAERLSAARAAAEVQDHAVVLPLTRLLTDDLFEVRAAAIEALGARAAEKDKKDAARALAKRLPKLAKSAQEEGEMKLLVHALHDLAQVASIKALMDDVEDSTSPEVYEARVMAVANVPDSEAIETLINHLARRGRGKWGGNKRGVVNALQYATGERLGADPDKWRAWWREAEKTFDFEAAAARRVEDAEKQRQRDERKRDRKKRKKGGSD